MNLGLHHILPLHSICNRAVTTRHGLLYSQKDRQTGNRGMVSRIIECLPFSLDAGGCGSLSNSRLMADIIMLVLPLVAWVTIESLLDEDVP